MRCAARLPVIVLLAITTLVLPTAAGADSGSDAKFVSLTNSSRGAHGLHGYAVSSDLTAVARRWAAHMAAHHRLEHNPNFAGQVCCWTRLGENVGVGSTVSQIHRAFMASSPHRANILSTSYTQVGIGTARGSDGKLYVDELFRRPTRAAPRTAQPVQKPVQHPVAVSHPVRAPAVAQDARASRSVRRPRLTAPHHRRSAAEVFLARLAAARSTAAGGYDDPVGGALAYLRVVTALRGSAH
jgi:hypothetical protein